MPTHDRSHSPKDPQSWTFSSQGNVSRFNESGSGLIDADEEQDELHSVGAVVEDLSGLFPTPSGPIAWTSKGIQTQACATASFTTNSAVIVQKEVVSCISASSNEKPAW